MQLPKGAELPIALVDCSFITSCDFRSWFFFAPHLYSQFMASPLLKLPRVYDFTFNQ